MSGFFASLWDSVFTPGPTPALILATNASFAALQVILFVLLIATYSIHFIILSGLCGGLWVGVNWFVHELEQEKARTAKQDLQPEAVNDSLSSGSAGMNISAKTKTKTNRTHSDRSRDPSSDRTLESQMQSSADAMGLETSTKSDLTSRKPSGRRSSEYASTDSEWDKVDEAGDLRPRR